jgi:hypothetical protein
MPPVRISSGFLNLYVKLFCAEFESVFANIYRWSVIEVSYEHINSLNSIFVYQTLNSLFKTVWFDIKINGSFLNRKSPCSRGVRCPPVHPTMKAGIEWCAALCDFLPLCLVLRVFFNSPTHSYLWKQRWVMCCSFVIPFLCLVLRVFFNSLPNSLWKQGLSDVLLFCDSSCVWS